MITRVAFAKNPLAVQVGLAAEAYGQLPTTLLDVHDGEMPSIDKFKYNLDIYSATQSYKEEKQEEQQKDQQSSGSSVATESEREELVNRQVSRAERREERERQGNHNSTVSEQAAQFDQLQQQRASAHDEIHRYDQMRPE